METLYIYIYIFRCEQQMSIFLLEETEYCRAIVRLNYFQNTVVTVFLHLLSQRNPPPHTCRNRLPTSLLSVPFVGMVISWWDTEKSGEVRMRKDTNIKEKSISLPWTPFNLCMSWDLCVSVFSILLFFDIIGSKIFCMFAHFNACVDPILSHIQILDEKNFSGLFFSYPYLHYSLKRTFSCYK